MDSKISSNSLQSLIKEHAAHRWLGGERKIRLNDEVFAKITTASIITRLKIFFGKEKSQTYEKVELTDAQGKTIKDSAFELSRFGMRNRTKELESQLGRVLSKINSNKALSDPETASTPSAINVAPKTPDAKPTTTSAPDAPPKLSTSTPPEVNVATEAGGTDFKNPNQSSVSKTPTKPSTPQPDDSVIPQSNTEPSIPTPQDANAADLAAVSKPSASTSEVMASTRTPDNVTVAPEATVASELQKIPNQLTETLLNAEAFEQKKQVKELVQNYYDSDSPEGSEFEQQLTNILDTLESKLQDNDANLENINLLAGNIKYNLQQKLPTKKSGRPVTEGMKTLQTKAQNLEKQIEDCLNVRLIEDIRSGNEEFTTDHVNRLLLIAEGKIFPQHHEALEVLIDIASRACNQIQTDGFFSINQKALDIWETVDLAFERSSFSPPEYAQLQQLFQETISKACQNFCNAENVSSQNITNLLF